MLDDKKIEEKEIRFTPEYALEKARERQQARYATLMSEAIIKIEDLIIYQLENDVVEMRLRIPAPPNEKFASMLEKDIVNHFSELGWRMNLVSRNRIESSYGSTFDFLLSAPPSKEGKDGPYR